MADVRTISSAGIGLAARSRKSLSAVESLPISRKASGQVVKVLVQADRRVGPGIKDRGAVDLGPEPLAAEGEDVVVETRGGTKGDRRQGHREKADKELSFHGQPLSHSLYDPGPAIATRGPGRESRAGPLC
jgi:hypothetical protein